MPFGLEEAAADFERWCHVRLLAAFQQAGLLTIPAVHITAASVLALHSDQGKGLESSSMGGPPSALADVANPGAHAGPPGAGHARMVAALLEILAHAGFLDEADAGAEGVPRFVTAAAVAGGGGATEVAGLDEAAERLCAGEANALASNVRLVDACLGALPGILAGAHSAQAFVVGVVLACYYTKDTASA